jgi:hypothetical protein
MSVVVAIAPENTRKHERVVVNLEAKVEREDGERPAVLADVGEGGVAVAAVEAPEVGAAVTVRFRLLRLACEASGRVVWRKSGSQRTRFGIAFDGSNPQMETFLRNLAAMPVRLRSLYLLDVADPRVQIA